jgi:3-phenylpropionate/trans-cinnamate dioxygenase ferredoxin subunit
MTTVPPRLAGRSAPAAGEDAGMATSSEPVARASDVAPGTTHRVAVGGEAILLCNVEGAIYAIQDLCTHDGGELDQGELDGCRIMCPRHGAYFDVTTGAALTLPAILPVRTYPVRVEGDAIFVEV